MTYLYTVEPLLRGHPEERPPPLERPLDNVNLNINVLITTPDERPPLLKGHFSYAKGLASQKGFHCTCNIDKFKILNINVSKQLNRCIQPDKTNCRKANFILDLISIKENPSHNFDMSHINELINYLCIE